MNDAREVDLALLMADLCGYTALTETHGALTASETVLRFVHLAKSCLEPGVAIVDSIGDAVFCAGEDTLAIVRTALRLRDSIEREPEFPRVSMGIHRGPIVEREGRLFGDSHQPDRTARGARDRWPDSLHGADCAGNGHVRRRAMSADRRATLQERDSVGGALRPRAGERGTGGDHH